MIDKIKDRSLGVDHVAEPGGNSESSWRGRIGWVEVLISLVAWQVFQVPVVVAALALGLDVTSSSGILVVLASAALSAPLAVWVALLVRRRFTFASIGLRRTTGRWVLVGAGLGVLAWTLNRGLVAGYVWITGDTSNPQQYLADAAGGTAWQFALLMLLGGLLVPFGEELIFRGVLYTWLRRWGVVLAVAISSLVFGLAHFSIGILLPATALVGVVAALAYERSGSLWPAIMVHAVNNTLIFSTILALRLAGIEF